MYNGDRENHLLYRVVGCPLFRGCLSIEGQLGLSELFVKQGSTVLVLNALRCDWLLCASEANSKSWACDIKTLSLCELDGVWAQDYNASSK